MKRVAVAVLSLIVWSLLPANPAAAEAGVDDEHDLLVLVNRARAEAGLPTSGVFDWPGTETSWRAQTFEFGYIAEYKPTGQAFFCTWKGACS